MKILVFSNCSFSTFSRFTHYLCFTLVPPPSRAAPSPINDHPLQLSKMNKDSDVITYDALKTGFETVCDLDLGASHQFISPQKAAFCSIYVTTCIQERVRLVDAYLKPGLRTTTARLSIQGITWLKPIYIIDIQQELDCKLIIFLGRQWLRQNNPVVDWTAGTIHTTGSDGTFNFMTRRGQESHHTQWILIQMVSLKRMQNILDKPKDKLFAFQLRCKSPPTVHKDLQDLVEDRQDVCKGLVKGMESEAGFV